MYKNLLTSINYSIATLCCLLFAGALFLVVIRPSEIKVIDDEVFKGNIPKNSFALPKESYAAINQPFLNLKYHPRTRELPDLRKTLIFYGKNGRPDALLAKPQLHFSFNGNKSISAVFPGQKLYLSYNKNATPPHYTFSKDNEKTALWIEADIEDENAIVKVFMENGTEEIIQEPPQLAKFHLKSTTQTKFGGGQEQQEIGGYRIDASLLARQKARWHGPDLFLEKHGGEEFSPLVGKQRIDFGDENHLYSIFVQPGDCLVWKENKWNVIEPGDESLCKPLLVVKKVDERIMNFELWDVEGKNKIVLNLIKAHEPTAKQDFDDTFKFVGARTRSQFVFEIDDERMLLRPKDWLVLTEDGWKKMTTSEEIDAYVERKISGPLFVFDGIIRKDDHQVFYGTIFNASRTDMQVIEMPIIQNTNHPGSIENLRQNEKNNPDTPVARSHYRNLSEKEY